MSGSNSIKIIAQGQHVQEIDIPIEIHAQKVLEWLVSRLHVSKDWKDKLDRIRRTKLKPVLDTIQQKHKSVLQSLKFDSHEFEFVDNWHLYMCEDLLASLVASGELPTAKNFFGSFSDPLLKSLDEIIGNMKSGNLFMADYALQIVQGVKYNIPEKRLIVDRLEKQSMELDRKAKDALRNADSIANQYQQKCKAMGISGVQIDEELQNAIAKQLPSFFDLIVEACRHPAVTEAIELYHNFTAFSSGFQEPLELLSDLRDFIRNGNTPVDKAPNQPEITIESPLPSEKKENMEDAAPSLPGIDWGGVSLSSLLQGTSLLSSENGSNATPVDTSVFEITIEDSDLASITVIDEGADPTSLSSSQQPQDWVLCGADFRSSVLSDLMELSAFLTQRKVDFEAETEDSSLVAELQSLPPHLAAFQNQSAINRIHVAVQEAVSAFTNPKLMELLDMRHSKSYSKRMAASISSVRDTEQRIRLNAGRLASMKAKYLADASAARQDLKKLKSETLKFSKYLEKPISQLYGGRPVHWIGKIVEAEGES